MKTVYKYPLEQPTIPMPEGAVIRDVAYQNGVPCIWAQVDLDKPLVTRVFTVIGTGHPVPDRSTYVKTLHNPPHVWHLYEIAAP